MQNPETTREALAETIGKTVRTVQRSLNRLIAAEKIMRIGGKKTGYWKII